MYSLGVSRSRLAALVLALLAAAVVTPVPVASAASTASATLCTGVSECKSKGYSDAGYGAASKNMYWRMFSGANCTNYAAYRLITTQGVTSTRPWTGSGNAENWGSTAALGAYRTSTPVVGAIAWWPNIGSAGHVAYVERVGTQSIVISESSWGGPVIRWRRISRDDSGRWPTGFLVLSLPTLASPAVTGMTKVSETVTASGVTLAPKVSADKVSYSWQLNGKTISGATAATYKPTTGQVGASLRVKVTVKRGALATQTLYSPASKVLPGTLAAKTVPAIQGTVAVDSAVTATAGTWNTDTSGVTYQWYAGGVAIPGATSARLVVPGSAAQKALTVRVTASAKGYASTTATSAARSVPLGTLGVTSAATLAGGAAVGAPLTAAATFSRPDVTLGYQWKADGVDVPGATGRTFSPRPQDVGKRLSVVVTASRSGYRAVSTTSATSAPITLGTMKATTPTVRGTAAVGRDLAVNGLSWAPGARYQYRWLADGKPVSGATGTRLTLTPQLLGKRITVQVTATAPGYVDVSRTSAATPKVARGTISATAAVTGSAKVGSRLKAAVTVKKPTAGTRTVRYQWLRDGKAIRGATTSTYRVSAADRKHRLSVRVTVGAAGYTAKVITTKRTGTVR